MRKANVNKTVKTLASPTKPKQPTFPSCPWQRRYMDAADIEKDLRLVINPDLERCWYATEHTTIYVVREIDDDIRVSYVVHMWHETWDSLEQQLVALLNCRVQEY